MDHNLTQAWRLLSLSRLFHEDQLAKLRARFDQEHPEGGEPEVLWDWLLKLNALTPFQAKLLQAGLNGPFRLDNYLVQDRVSQGPLEGTFLARHLTSQYPVQLDFYAEGSSQAGWQKWLERASQLANQPHPALVRTFEAVTLPDYAFIVSEVPAGVPLEQKLPRKARLSWNQAVAFGAQLAAALAALEKIGLAHGGLSPRTVWLVGKSQVQLRNIWQPDANFEKIQTDTDEAACDYQAPELQTGSEPRSASDLYSLGCLLYRLISGRPITQGATLEEKKQSHVRGVVRDLSKYEVPPDLQQLVDRLVSRQPEERPQSPSEVARQLADLAGQPLERLLPRSDPAPALLALLKAITEQTPVVSGTRLDEPAAAQVGVAPLEEPLPAKPATPVPSLTLGELRALRQAKQRRFFLATASSLLLFAAFLGLLAWSLTWSKTTPAAGGSGTASATVTGINPAQQAAETGELLPSETNAVVRQRVIPDDGQTLWQSPTSGRAANLAYLPPGARLVLIARPADMLGQPEGQLLFQALDSGLQETINHWSGTFVTPLGQIASVAVGLYPTETQEYQTLARISFVKPVPRTELGDRWQVDLLTDAADTQLISRGNESILLLPYGGPLDENSPAGTGRPPGLVDSFLYGPTELVTAARDSARADNLSGPFAALNQVIDGQRHLNLLFQPAGLFNDEGQWLMSGAWAPLNGYLRGMLDESARAGLFSLHIDDGVYLELTLCHSVDKRPAELRQRLEKQLRLAREDAVAALTTMSSNPYWERVRLRYDNMLNDLARQLRTGVERQLVIANAWLPPMAAHNLLAASELALSLGDAAAVPMAENQSQSAPQSLEELLALPRSLAVTTNPDLNLLLQGIATEVNEQFPELPFKFKIELAGTDLAKEGITQNQRPGDFTAEQRPLSAILTEIMVRANPDKSATEASNPNCKLVWVIALDPNNPAERIIQVTTRAAAQERGLTLPPDFQPAADK